MSVLGSAEYMIICYVAAALCILSLLITLFLFFKLNIVGVIGDLTGSTARKGIETIRSENARTGNKAHKVSQVNKERGKLTDRITPSGNLKSKGALVELSVGTERFNTGKLEAKDLYNSINDTDNGETVVITGIGDDETTVLAGNMYSEETTVLNDIFSDETTLLDSKYSEETTVLPSVRAESEFFSQSQERNVEIVVEDEIVFIHSDERID